MWELRRNGVVSEPISEADLEEMLASGAVEGAMPVRPVGKDAWKPALRHAPFASAASRAPRREGSTLLSKSNSASPPAPKDPARWDQQTQLNMPVPQFGASLPTPLPPPPLPPPAPTLAQVTPPPLPIAPAVEQTPAGRPQDPPHPLVTVQSAPPLVLAKAAATPTTRSNTGRGFTAGLLDFSFTTFVTTRVVKVLYVLFLMAVGLGTIAGIMAGLSTTAAGSAMQSQLAMALGLAQIAFTPIAALMVVICGRIAFESIVVFFRVAEHLAEINRKTQG